MYIVFIPLDRFQVQVAATLCLTCSRYRSVNWALLVIQA